MSDPRKEKSSTSAIRFYNPLFVPKVFHFSALFNFHPSFPHFCVVNLFISFCPSVFTHSMFYICFYSFSSIPIFFLSLSSSTIPPFLFYSQSCFFNSSPSPFFLHFLNLFHFSLLTRLILCFTLDSDVESITFYSNFGSSTDYFQDFHNFPLPF